MDTGFIDHGKIESYLANTLPPEKSEVREILQEARQLKGIGFDRAERLLMLEDPALLEEVFETANFIKNEIYGRRLVLFAPLYVSNLCMNDCLYCAFRKSNKEISRKTLTIEEIKRETEILVSQGHKRILLVSGEGLGLSAVDYSIKAIEAVYSVKVPPNGEIRRVNINIAALPVESYNRL